MSNRVCYFFWGDNGGPAFARCSKHSFRHKAAMLAVASIAWGPRVNGERIVNLVFKKPIFHTYVLSNLYAATYWKTDLYFSSKVKYNLTAIFAHARTTSKKVGFYTQWPNLPQIKSFSAKGQ